MACSSCPQNVIWINDSNKWFLPAFLPSFIFPSLPFPPIYPSFLPSFHLGLHNSSITQHPSNSSFLSSLVPAKSKVTRDSLTRVLKTFQFALLKPIKIYFSSRRWKKKINFGFKFLLREKSSQRKSMAIVFSINGYWIRLYCFLPEQKVLLFSRAISTILSWGYQKRIKFTFL